MYSLRISSTVLATELKQQSSPELEPSIFFGFRPLLLKAPRWNKCGRGTARLSCLISELLYINQDYFFGGCGMCSDNLLVISNNSGLGAVLLSCLVSELEKPLSPGLEPGTHFYSFNLSKISSCFQEIRMRSLRQTAMAPEPVSSSRCSQGPDKIISYHT